MIDPPDGERLRSAWRALAADATDDPPVDDESIWRAAVAEAPENERYAVVDAVARDPAAAESWRLAQELQRQLERRRPEWRLASPDAREALSGRPAPLWRSPWVAIAAMLLLGLGLGFWRVVGPRPGGSDREIFRDSDRAELSSLVPEDVAQPRERVILSWSDAGDGAHYTVRVLRPNLEPLVVLRELTSSSVRLPAERFRDVVEGERLLWQVEARLADGQSVTSSTFFLDLIPASEGSTPTNVTHPQEP